MLIFLEPNPGAEVSADEGQDKSDKHPKKKRRGLKNLPTCPEDKCTSDLLLFSPRWKDIHTKMPNAALLIRGEKNIRSLSFYRESMVGKLWL